MPELPPPAANRWAVLGIIMLGTFMAILDASIVNVALPNMMSALGANRDRIEWVATAFMIASACAMPLVGWLTGRVGYKSLYLSSLFVFTAGSALCAFAWNLESLVVARVIQAVGGGAVQPIGMAIVADLFAPHERGKALGVWGTGIMVAPAVGPTLGGYLTDAFGWRSIFSVNLPIGAVTLVLGLITMHGHALGRRRRFDVWGYAFLLMALIAGLTALADGQDKGWGSAYIHTCVACAAVGSILFVAVEMTVSEPLLDLRLLLIRNYALSMLLAVFRAVGLFGGVFLLPLFLENLVGYTTIQTGVWMIAGAVAVGITMPIAGRLADHHSPAVLVSVGCVLAGASLLVYGHLDPLSSWQMIILPQLVRGVGLALMMSPLLAAALNSVPRHEIPMASGFLNVAQNVGASFGIALLNNHVTNAIHRHAVQIGTLLPTQSPEYARLAQRAGAMVMHHTTGTAESTALKAGAAAAMAISRHAQVLGFGNGFTFAGLIMLSALPLSVLLQTTGRQGDSRPAAIE